MEEYFSIKQVSEKLNLSQKTIRRHISSGRLASYKIGGAYRINEVDIESFLNGNKVNDVGQFNLFPQMGTFKSNTKSKVSKKLLDQVNWAAIDDKWDEVAYDFDQDGVWDRIMPFS